LEQPRILIVDDEPFNLDLLEQELELLGYGSVRAVDGRNALERLQSEAFDLVLLDVMMPGIDGFGVLERMKSHPKWQHIPVIMISAMTDMASIVRCITNGAEDYLPKPFEPILLQARVGASLERKRSHDREIANLELIELERQRADELLHAILPETAVAELKATGSVQPRLFDEVAVLFVDLADFTAWCHAHPPEEVVADVQRLAEAFEEFADRHGMEKIKTIGDAFMATANLLQPHGDPVMAAIRCCYDMADAAHRDPNGWRIRAGIHIGPVVAGSSAGRNSTSTYGAIPSMLRRGYLRSARRTPSTSRQMRSSGCGAAVLSERSGGSCSKAKAKSRCTSAVSLRTTPGPKPNHRLLRWSPLLSDVEPRH